MLFYVIKYHKFTGFKKSLKKRSFFLIRSRLSVTAFSKLEWQNTKITKKA